MDLTHIRTENGVSALITWQAACTEIEAGMGFPDRATKRAVRCLSAAGQSANIEYRDGRKVSIRPATPEEIAELTTPSTPKQAEEAPETDTRGRLIVTVKGKRYIVGRHITQPQTTPDGRVWPGGVDYWTERNGTTFGPTRVALGNSKPGTVGAAIWAAVTR